MKLTEQQRYVLGRANRQLMLDGDLLAKPRISQAEAAGRSRVITALYILGLIDNDGYITEAGRAALSQNEGDRK